jgi:hypothetical protein
MYEKELRAETARRTPQHGGILYRDRIEDLSKVEFNECPYRMNDTEGNNLNSALRNAAARRDVFLKTLEGDLQKQPVGERDRVFVDIYMLVLADELKVVGYRYMPRGRKKD